MARFLCILLIAAWVTSPAYPEELFEVHAATGPDRLVARDGSVLRLAGLVHMPENAEALTRLRALAAGQSLTLRNRQLNRYGEGSAQAYLPDGRWLNGLLVTEGWMRASSLTADTALRTKLFRLENIARAHGVGHWGSRRFREYPAVAYDGPRDRYAIVTGRPVATARKRDFLFLNFGDDWKQDFTAAIRRRDLKAFRGIDLEALAGRPLRLRGHVRWWNGPFMELDGPGQIELLPDGAANQSRRFKPPE